MAGRSLWTFLLLLGLNRVIASRYYLGGRIGMSRVRGHLGERAESYVDPVVGLQAGVRVVSWLDAGVEAVAADPELSDGTGFPADIRGFVTVSF